MQCFGGLEGVALLVKAIHYVLLCIAGVYGLLYVGPHLLVFGTHRSLRVHYYHKLLALRYAPWMFNFVFSRRPGLAKRYRGRRI